MKVLLNEQGYVVSYAFEGDLLDAVEAAEPADLSHFEECFTTYRVQDGVENLDLVRLRDDDSWHTATVDLRELTRRLPGIRMIKQWRFITGGNGRRGDRYWVDDFQIRRAQADAGTDGDQS